MKFRTIIFAIQLPLLWCCASQAEKGNVVFETAADASALTDVIKRIEIIPLERQTAPLSDRHETLKSVCSVETTLLPTGCPPTSSVSRLKAGSSVV